MVEKAQRLDLLVYPKQNGTIATVRSFLKTKRHNLKNLRRQVSMSKTTTAQGTKVTVFDQMEIDSLPY